MKKAYIIAILVVALGIGIAYKMIEHQQRLPIYNPADLSPELVDENVRDVRSKHRTLPFSLTNQNNETITNEFVKGKIHVVDFFFTTCPSICPIMSDQMEVVQKELGKRGDFKILSFTVDPDKDSPGVLKEYAELHGANDNVWQFLTGDKKDIYQLARQSYFAVTTKGAGDSTDFIHTENFVLVDKKGRLRGFYDGTSADEVQTLIEDIEKLDYED